MIRCILVPTDFSPHSRAALGSAIELAKGLSARIVLLNSYWVDLSRVSRGPFVIPSEFAEQMRLAAEADLEGMAKQVREASIPVETQAVAEAAIPAILSAAGRLPADLIVMGTEGLTGLKHALLGSVAERVVRLAPCPVLTVKAAKPD